MNVYICVCIYLYTCMYMRVCMCIHIYMYTYGVYTSYYIYISLYMYTYIPVSICIRIHICIYIYLYMYIYISPGGSALHVEVNLVTSIKLRPGIVSRKAQFVPAFLSALNDGARGLAAEGVSGWPVIDKATYRSCNWHRIT